MGVFVRIAVRNLVQARRRTFFLTLALSLVTALLVLLLGLSQGLTDTIVRSATTLASGHVNVAGFYKAKPSDANPLVIDSKKLRKLVEEKTPGVDFVIDRARGWARIVSDTSSLNSSLTGIDINEEDQLAQTLRFAAESEYKEGGREAALGRIEDMADEEAMIVFAGQAKRLGVTVGDRLTVAVETISGARNTAEFRVVGVAKDIGFMSNWNVFLHKEGIRKLYNLGPDVSGAIQIYLEDADQAETVMGHLTEVLNNEGYELMEHNPNPFFMKFDGVMGEDWTGQKLDLTIWKDEVSFLMRILTAVDYVSFVLVGILVFIIAVGIMNSMWMSVRERTTEVGTLRAIGMSRARVLIMFLLEALLLGLFATALGAALGSSLALSLDAAQIEVPVDAVRMILMSDVLHLVVQPGQVVTAVVVFTCIAGLSAFLPAYRASKMQPVTAIQHIN